MATYKPLQSISLTSAATSVTFSGIDQNYTDLIVSVNGTSTSLVDSYCRINGDTSSLYSYTRLYGTGSSAASDRSLTQTEIKSGNFTTTPNSHDLHFLDYSNTTINKTVLFNTKESSSALIVHAGLWRSTQAINSITIFVTSGTFNAGTTFDLYGIKSGAPQALGGDVVTTDGNYWYHTFNSTQTFTPLKTLSADVLVVAGGGGGGSHYAGGGGAGGYRTATSMAVAAQTYSIQVGAGGAGGVFASTRKGANGTDSVFSTITSTGGGGATGRNVATLGSTGGSGAGGAGAEAPYAAGLAGNTPSTSPSQGNNGGNGIDAGAGSAGGGGGGSGSAGGNASSGVVGTAGSGTANSISGSSVTYAAGSTGGKASSGAGASGTVNRGNGGGGGGDDSAGGAGGSGIVIVRYPV
jgi:hypothetical protein